MGAAKTDLLRMEEVREIACDLAVRAGYLKYCAAHDMYINPYADDRKLDAVRLAFVHGGDRIPEIVAILQNLPQECVDSCPECD